MKKYDIIEKLRIVKDILNVFRNDAKRFTSLTNKFKKLDFKYVNDKDGAITAITINDVPNDVFEAFLDSAHSNARSEKVKILLSNILDNKASVAEIKKEKTPTKTTKTTKKAKTAKPAKEKTPTKTAKPAKEKAAAKEITGSINEKVATWVNGSFDDKTMKKMQEDILDAFKTDSRLNTTMENWMKKSSDLKSQVINMFITAYTRKPNNGKMKTSGWYLVFDKWAEVGVSEKPKPIKESKVKVPKAEVTAEVKAEVKAELSSYTLMVYDSLFVGIRCNKGNVSKINGSCREKDVEQMVKQFSLDKTTDIKQLTYTIQVPMINSNLLEVEIKRTLIKEIFNDFISKNNIADDSRIEEESKMFSSGLENVFVTNVVLNLIFCTSGGIGFGNNQLRGEILETIASKLTLPEKTKDADKICEKYLEDTKWLNQIDLYTLNRKIVNAALEVIVKYDTFVSYFNVIGQYIMNSLIIKNNSNTLIITREESKIDEVPQEDDSIKYTVTAREISFVFQGTSFNIPKNNEKYSEIYQAVINNDKDALDELVTTYKKLTENIKTVLDNLVTSEDNEDTSNIDIKIVDKNIYCNNKIFKGLASIEFIKYIAENNVRMISQFKRFIFNCSLNPSNASVEELYDFVVKNRLKVTPAGTILLYKWVKGDYHDCRTGKFNNAPGLTIKMDRSKVNPNRHDTCSNGLHLCSYKYGKFGDRLLLVELDPKNSVSIPSDYSQSKMRCCEYTSLMDITEFVSVMDSEGDFLSKVENIHYNTKIIEMELMKMYPDVVRRNSINGLNDLTGRDQDKIAEIALSFKVPELEVIDVTDSEEFLVEECMVPEEPELELVEEPETFEEKVTEPVKEPEPESVINIDEAIIKNIELFLGHQEYNPLIINGENYEKIIDKLKVIDELIFGYTLQKTNKKTYENTQAKLLDILNVFRYIKNDEVSVSEISEDAKLNATKLKLDTTASNPDNVSVYETPKEPTILGSISKIFKKLW